MMIELGFDGRPPRTPVGYFTYTVRDDHWSWSDGVFHLHGYDHGAVDPTTELLLRHKHPDDALRAYEVLEEAATDGGPFSCYHRIIDNFGEVRYVLSVGMGTRGAGNGVEQVTGFFVDMTAARARDLGDAAARAGDDMAVVRLAERRAVVERAKGIVMVVQGCDEQQAFRALRECAASRGERVYEVAGRLVERARDHPLLADDPSRTAVEEMLVGSPPSP